MNRQIGTVEYRFLIEARDSSKLYVKREYTKVTSMKITMGSE